MQMEEHNMVDIPVLQTDRLILPPFTMADAPRVEALLATPEIADTTTVSFPYPEGAGAAWIATHADDAAADRGISWAITLPDDTVVGTIGLSLTPKHRRASAGYWLGVAYWNHGYTSEALRSVVA
jgi:RimJ/RimL family protein N-acetyltransferase